MEMYEKTKQIMRNYAACSLVLLGLLVGAELRMSRIAKSYLSVANNSQSLNLHVHSLQHGAGVSIHIDLLLGEGRHGGDEVKTTLSLLLLELQGDAAHRSSLDSLHQVLRCQ